jgi:hypothetical protein
MTRLRCPTTPHDAHGNPHTVIGCGSTNTTEPDDEGLVDCGDCGIWFDPTRESITEDNT